MGLALLPRKMGCWIQERSWKPEQVKRPLVPSLYPRMVGRIMASQSDLWICYITWQRGIKDADGIKVANQLTLKHRDCSELSGQAHCIHKGPYMWNREAEKSVSEGCDVRRTCLAIVDFECGRADKTRNEGSLQQLGKTKQNKKTRKRIVPQTFQKGMQPNHQFDCSWMRPCQTSDRQNCKIQIHPALVKGG